MSNENQVPTQQIFGAVSENALDLSNYVDMMFKQEPVETVVIPMLEKSENDVKLDSKLNTNADNFTVIGGDNLRAMMYPSDTAIELDIEAIAAAQGCYTAETAGYIMFCIQDPDSVQGDVLTITNTNNGMFVTDTAKGTWGIAIALPASKYQVFQVACSLQNSRTMVNVCKLFLIPAGTDANAGESIANTRDYKALMAGIGYPAVNYAQAQSLPESGAILVAPTNGYYSFKGLLTDATDYFAMSTEYTMKEINYNANAVSRLRGDQLPVASGTEVKFEYSLSHQPEYFAFVPAVGSTGE